MKTKVLGLVFASLILAALLINNDTRAISGACSYHGGVNCSAGPSSGGNVVCNDGWLDSSVSYYDSVACGSTPILLCVYPYVSGCSTEQDYSRLRAQWAISGYPETMQANLDECRSSIDEYARKMDEYNQCWVREYGYDRTTGQIIYTPTPMPTPIDYNLLCQKYYGQYAGEAPDKPGYCSCIAGYSFDSNDQCVSQESYCKKLYGNNAQVIDRQGTCGCLSGYQFDSSRSLCAAVTPSPSVAFMSSAPIPTQTATKSTPKPSPRPILKQLSPKPTKTPTSEEVSVSPTPTQPVKSFQEPTIQPRRHWLIRFIKWLF